MLASLKIEGEARRTLNFIPFLGTTRRFMSSVVDDWDSIMLCHVDASRSIVSVTGSEHPRVHVHRLSINLNYFLDWEDTVLG